MTRPPVVPGSPYYRITTFRELGGPVVFRNGDKSLVLAARSMALEYPDVHRAYDRFVDMLYESFKATDRR